MRQLFKGNLSKWRNPEAQLFCNLSIRIEYAIGCNLAYGVLEYWSIGVMVADCAMLSMHKSKSLFIVIEYMA